MRIDWAALPDAVKALLAEPSANLTASVLVLVIATLVVLALVIGIALVGLPRARRARQAAASEAEGAEAEEALPAEEPALRDKRAIVWGVVLIIVLLAGAAYAYHASGTDRFCLGCHPTIAPDTTPELRPEVAEGLVTEPTVEVTVTPLPDGPSGVHADANCVDCHEDGLPLGLVANLADRLRHTSRDALDLPPRAIPGTESERCLRCHDLAEPLEARGIRMSHAEPLASGMVCFECHVDLGHRMRDSAAPGMSVCVRCHDDVIATAGCEVCHLGKNPWGDSIRRVFAPATLAGLVECGDCHDQRPCDSCHGLRMPHTEVFKAYDHARFSGFDKKKLCWRCHTVGDCAKCHETKQGIWGHGSGDTWKKQHATFPPGRRGCGCHAAHPTVAKGDFCLACHEDP
jgi:hypothetical protein